MCWYIFVQNKKKQTVTNQISKETYLLVIKLNLQPKNTKHFVNNQLDIIYVLMILIKKGEGTIVNFCLQSYLSKIINFINEIKKRDQNLY
jgi:hypothetical protein